MIDNLNEEEVLALLTYYVKSNELTKALELCNGREFELTSITFIHAAILCQIGLYERAILLFKKVIESDPDNQLCRFQLGVAYFFSGKNDLADEVWEGQSEFIDFIEAFRLISNNKFYEASNRLDNFIYNNKSYPELNLDAENLKEKINRLEQSEIQEEHDVNELVTNDVETLLSIYKQ
ncbi:hypothetical protein MHN79_06520 [Vibrio sp. Of14-4]|uniref:hypothetical protein n=1 Tax=Vibrio sp. Of14-4 TaxID=2724878 RepID=UPI001EF2F0C4|nr:hypothetical protein [Vibrio sp. Of14-4]MCG7489137.1 hypothetical protein [Vibrio sp. Of14-4]